MDNKITITPAILADLDTCFGRLKPDEKIWMIYFNGRPIAMSNGKAHFRKIGHAKTSLINDFKYGKAQYASFLPKNSYDYVDSDVLRDFLKQLESEGFIKYVAIDIDKV